MQRREGRTLFPAGDIVGFLECERATRLALRDLQAALDRAEDDASLQLNFLSELKRHGLQFADLASRGIFPREAGD